jgi:hypothetical protein
MSARASDHEKRKSPMNTHQTLMLHALKAKQLNDQGFSGGDLVGNLIDGQEEVKAKMKNICAFISPELFNEVDVLTHLLELSKRQVVEMALVDFIEKANAVINEVDVFENVKDSDQEA